MSPSPSATTERSERDASVRDADASADASRASALAAKNAADVPLEEPRASSSRVGVGRIGNALTLTASDAVSSPSFARLADKASLTARKHDAATGVDGACSTTKCAATSGSAAPRLVGSGYASGFDSGGARMRENASTRTDTVAVSSSPDGSPRSAVANSTARG